MPDYGAHHCRMPNHGGRELAEYVAMKAQLKKKWLHPFSSGDSGGIEYDPVQRADWNLAEFTPLICPCANEVEAPQRADKLSGIELIAETKHTIMATP